MTSRPPALFAWTRVARVSISADAYDHAMDSLVLLGGAHQPVPMTAQAIAEGAEYRALANYHSRSKRNGPLVFCESHAGKCGRRQRFRTRQADRSNTARQRALGLAAFVDRLRGGPGQVQAGTHARQPTPDGGDPRDARGLANLGEQYGGFPGGGRLIHCRCRVVREIHGHAPSFSASSGKLATTMSCRGSGSGSGGPSAPHSSGRRTKAVR